MTSEKGKWHIDRNPNVSIPSPTAPVAEPSHRVGPPGVSSGVSHRQLPKSCVVQVRDICLHYVAKCSGKYVNNEMAARYIHQMADEVINQLAGVAADIKRHVNEPEILQKLLDEWNDSFPATMGQMGTPKAIALKLEQQARRISDLTAALQSDRLSHVGEVDRLTRSIDVQLLSCRNGVMAERRSIATVHKQEIDALQGQLLQTRESHADELAQIRKQHAKALSECQQKASQAFSHQQQESEVEKLQLMHSLETLTAEHTQMSSQFKESKQMLGKRVNDLKQQIRQYKNNQILYFNPTKGGGHPATEGSRVHTPSDMAALLAPVEEDTDDEVDLLAEDDMSVQDDEATDDEDDMIEHLSEQDQVLEGTHYDADGLASENGRRSSTPTGTYRPSSTNSMVSRLSTATRSCNKRNKGTQISFNALVHSGHGNDASVKILIKELKEEIEILSRKVDEDEKIMSDRQSLIDDYAAMRESDKKQLEKLELANQALRAAIQLSQQYYNADTKEFEGRTADRTVTVNAKGNVSCHTPDFLQKADVSGYGFKGVQKRTTRSLDSIQGTCRSRTFASGTRTHINTRKQPMCQQQLYQ